MGQGAAAQAPTVEAAVDLVELLVAAVEADRVDLGDLGRRPRRVLAASTGSSDEAVEKAGEQGRYESEAMARNREGASHYDRIESGDALTIVAAPRPLPAVEVSGEARATRCTMASRTGRPTSSCRAASSTPSATDSAR
jgi:hypothetical protein